MVTMNIIDSTLVSICREMGLTMMKTAYSTIFNEGMDFTCGLGNIKDGKYSFENHMEDDGIETKPYRNHVDVHVQGEEVMVDYSASDGQAKGPINAVLSVA